MARAIADWMDVPLTVLGVLFLLLIVADATVEDPAARRWFDVASWVLWAVFVLEFVLRLVIAPSATGYLRRNWWQLVFLALPFLRFLRVAGRLARLRPARLARIVSSAVRGARTAARTLSSRLAWLAALTAIVALSSSVVLVEFAGYEDYAAALHDAAYATITGEPIQQDHPVADVLELVLALYAVVVFAFLAGSLGAYFLERGRERESMAAQEGAATGRE